MKKITWTVQILLAIAFGMAGFMKLTAPYEELLAAMPWAEDFSLTAIRIIGGLELAGALGLILPAVTGIMPILTAIAPAGLALTMVGAMIVHMGRGESVIFNLVLLALASFAAWGRWKYFHESMKPAPIIQK